VCHNRRWLVWRIFGPSSSQRYPRLLAVTPGRTGALAKTHNLNTDGAKVFPRLARHGIEYNTLVVRPASLGGEDSQAGRQPDRARHARRWVQVRALRDIGAPTRCGPARMALFQRPATRRLAIQQL